MSRLGGFPQNRLFNHDALFEAETSISGPGVTRVSLPPGPEREATLAGLLEAFRERTDDLPAIIDELRDLMAGRDLTQLINSVVVPAMMGAPSEGGSLADGDATSTWAAKVEYLVGIGLSLDPSGDADTPPEVTQRVSQLISDIFEADQARMLIASLENADAGDAEREQLLYQLQLEYQVDRMPGYAVHLEHVDTEVFGRHRDYYLSALGFDPADVVRVTRLHSRSVNTDFNAAFAALADLLNGGQPNTDVEALTRNPFDPITLWTPDEIADSTGIAADQITAMLDFFSTEYGCQPEFRVPGDTNRARTHPCIKLDDGTYFIPDPWSLSAVIHQRLAVEPKGNGFDPQKYHKHRQDAHERLVTAAFTTVFGTGNVYAAQHYDLASGDHGEIDTLVCAEWPLVVEAKAIALTESGRQGSPRRVDTKIKEILGKPLDQTNRALTYILDEGGRTFSAKQGGRLVELLPSEVCGGTAVIVTFERMDPFAWGGLDVAGDVKRPTWVVSLTDLLMVADILTDPTAFQHYARTRASMHAASASTFAEADALGAYLLDRLRIVRGAAREQHTQVLIDYSCEALNDFYTRQEAGLVANKPVTGVPDEVTSTLANALTQPGWTACADAVMDAETSVWKKWKRFRKKHRRGGTFNLTDRVSLVSVSNGQSSLHQVDGSITLTIPTQR